MLERDGRGEPADPGTTIITLSSLLIPARGP
jgi:hypothetical protein